MSDGYIGGGLVGEIEGLLREVLQTLTLKYRGTWSSNTPYDRYDVVKYDGAYYIVMTPHLSSGDFGTDIQKYELLAANSLIGSQIYNNSTQYIPGQFVLYNDSLYQSKAIVQGNPPPDETYWTLIVADLGRQYADSVAITGGSIFADRLGAESVDTNLVPLLNDTYDLGSGDLRWQDIFAKNVNANGTITNGVISLSNNEVQTVTTNTDLVLNPQGTGYVVLDANTRVEGNLDVNGNVSITGNIFIGDSQIDTVTVMADFTSHLLPDASNNYDLGSTTKTWRNVYTGTVYTNYINNQGGGEVNVDTNLRVTGNLRVIGAIQADGSLTLGDANTDNIIFNADVNSDILPNASGAFDLGSETKLWDRLFVEDVFADQILVNNQLTVGNIRLSGNTIVTTETNQDLNINPDGTGRTIISGNATIDGTLTVNNTITTANLNQNLVIDPNGTGVVEIRNNTTISGNLDVDGNITLTGNLRIGDTTLDTVTVIADFTSNLLPDVTNTYSLGSSIKSWNNVHANRVYTNTIDDNGAGSITFDTNISITGTLDVDGQTTLASLNVEDLTAGRVVYVGASGKLVDNANLTFSGTLLTVTGSQKITSTLDVDGVATVAGAVVEDLTPTRLVYVGTGDRLVDSANLTFSGTQLNINGTLNVEGQTTVNSLNVQDLIATRLVYVGSDGELVDNVGLWFDGSKLRIDDYLSVGLQATFTSANVEDLTAGRVVLAGTLGELEDSANLTFNGTLLTVTGNQRVTGNLDVDGNITIGGNLRIGNQDVDTVTVVADFTSNLVPDEDYTYDLGTVDKSWRELYVTRVKTDNIITNGATTLTLQSDTKIDGDLWVTGNLRADGTLTLGDSNTDNIVFSADVNSDVLPNTDNAFDLGADAARWKTLYVHNAEVGSEFTIGSIKISGNTITTLGEDQDLILDPNGAGQTKVKGSIEIEENLTVKGSTFLGDSNLDTVTVQADIASALIPDARDVYDLGTDEKRWRTIYASTGKFDTELALSTLTEGRVVLVGPDGALTDVPELSFSRIDTGLDDEFGDPILEPAFSVFARITDVITPINPADAANKEYVDGAVNSIASLNLIADNGVGQIDLSVDILSVYGTEGEVEVTIDELGTTLTVGLPDDVVISNALEVTGTLTHQGLIMTEGTGIDQITTITQSLTLSEDWQDTGIQGDMLVTGTYMVQLFANDGITNNNEYYSGTMSWFAGPTFSSVELPTDEVVLHRAGASGDAGLYLRTYRSNEPGGGDLKLQMYSNISNPSASNYVFKFRRMI